MRLCEEKVKNRCCRRALLCGILLFAGRFDEEEICLYSENLSLLRLVSDLSSEAGEKGNVILAEENDSSISRFSVEHPEKLLSLLRPEGKERHIEQNLLRGCPSCLHHFLRGVFLSCGTVTDPNRSYHLEFSTPEGSPAEELNEVLVRNGLHLKSFLRGNDHVYYSKESETLEDFLNLIGAQSAAFEIMNTKITKSIRNDANRIVNCETSNIDKAIKAARNGIDAIEELIRSGRFQALPPELRETAELRLSHPEAGLAELASLHEPPVSKSGVNHRLKKLIDLSGK